MLRFSQSTPVSDSGWLDNPAPGKRTGWMWEGQLWLAASCPKRHPFGIQETTPYSAQGHCGDRAVVNGNTCVSTIRTCIHTFSHKHTHTHTQPCIVFSLSVSPSLIHSPSLTCKLHSTLCYCQRLGLYSWKQYILCWRQQCVCVCDCWRLMPFCQHSAGLWVCVYECVCVCLLLYLHIKYENLHSGSSSQHKRPVWGLKLGFKFQLYIG